ncbi:MAG TPA: S8 family serine peptidase [Myxococcaceae bacterium]|nr:S8 family serine peptidase [Myxococcaceae bacterium]
MTTAPPDELNKARSLSQGGKDGDEAPYQTEFGAEDAHVPGRLIIQLTPELTDAVNADAGKGAPFSRWAWPEPMREAFAELRVHAVAPVLPLGAASPEKLASLQEVYARRHQRGAPQATLPRLDAFFLVELPLEADLVHAEETFAAIREVVSVEPDAIVQTFNTYGNPTYQWGLHTIQAPQVWSTTAGAGVNVAVVDTGVDLTHPDLQGNLLPGATFVPGTASAQDDNGHGTHVAGVIAAVNDSLGIVGVAPGAKIIPIKALNSAGSGQTTWLLNAYLHALNTGVTDVINNSWGGSGTSAAMDAAVQAAHQLGIVTVNAAGNASTTTYGFFPSNIEYGLSVAASTAQDGHASYSNTGVKLDVAAPGGSGASPAHYASGVLSTVQGSYAGAGVLLDQGAKYAPMSGTSMAAPHVSGLAALLLAANPGWTVEQIRQAIRKGATDVGATGFDVTSGHGRISVPASMQISQPPSAQIIHPRNDATVYGTAQVSGFALPSPGQSATWELFAGSGTAPTSWVSLAQGGGAVNDAALASVDTRLVPDGEVTFLLRTTNVQNGQTAEDRNLVHVDNVAIAYPFEGQHLYGSQSMVTGRAEGAGLQSWTLAWAPGHNATGGFTTIANGTSPVTANNLLANWNLGSLPEGELSLRLTAQFPGHVSTHQINVLMDQRLLPGFPMRIRDPMGFKTPKIADLDLDGSAEIVVGDAVYQSNGLPRPGWTVDPKLGRTVPAIADIDGVPGLEIVNASFESYFYDASLPNGGAPVITAKRADNTLVWSFPVTHATSTVHNGTPSSISIGNVTGDNALEVVFTMHFVYANPGNVSTVFVLDAATGTLLHRWETPGFNWSALALADLDDDGKQDLVFATYESSTQLGRVHAMRGDGTYLPGWPQVSPSNQGFGELAPVIGDVDNDCRYEILAGSTLYRRNGTTVPGWPTNLIARSTGALANLQGGYPFEVALGGGNSVASWYANSNASLNLALTNTFENLYVMGFNENYKQGHPLLADVDGDGKIDLVRQSELGTVDPNRAMPIYAFDLQTGQRKSQTRRVRSTEPGGNYSFPLYSTGAIGDVDGDGRLDLVLVSANQLYAWRLDGVATPANMPWPMYQRDLRNSGTAPMHVLCNLGVVNPGPSPWEPDPGPGPGPGPAPGEPAPGPLLPNF